MPEKVLKTPATATLQPGEELLVRVELNMHGESMLGPHRFRFLLPVQGQDGSAQPPLEIYVKGHFGGEGGAHH